MKEYTSNFKEKKCLNYLRKEEKRRKKHLKTVSVKECTNDLKNKRVLALFTKGRKEEEKEEALKDLHQRKNARMT